MTLLAGAARSDITPGAGVELMGYGLRSEVSCGIHDPLYARALYLGSADVENRGILVVSADLCLILPDQAREIRERIASRAGLPREHILVACTHTHSGPETGISALVRGRPAPRHIPPLLDGIVDAAERARAQARAARFRWSQTEAFIGRNRRLRDGPLDPEVRVLQVQAREGSTIAVVFHHGCHPTVLGHDNLEISADWPGAAAAQIQKQTGATALFLLGAHGDVDPRTRGLKDLAIPGQSIGLGFEAVGVLGSEVAEAVLASLGAAEPDWQEGPIGAASGTTAAPLHLGELSAAAAEAALGAYRDQLTALLGLSGERLPPLSRLEDAIRAQMHGRPAAEVRERIGLMRAYIRDKTASRFVADRRQLDVEVQVLRVGPVALLGLPIEPTVEVGLDWKDRAADQGLLGAVVSIGNGWLRYLPHPRDLAHPQSHLHYEVLSSLLAPGSCEKILSAGERLLEQLSTP